MGKGGVPNASLVTILSINLDFVFDE